jgi:sigma-E factor negative regulatory protein RseB
VDTRSRPGPGPLCPGTDPAALRLITAAVLAGLVASGIVVISRHAAPAGAADLGRPGAQAMMAAGSLPRVPRATAASAALTLLGRAAHACGTVDYEGVEVLEDWGATGQATSVVNVWHAPGEMTLTQAVRPAPHWAGEAPHVVLPASSLSGQTLVGNVMLGMSERLVALLAANYRLAVGGRGRVAGRQARVVTARRPGGGLAARFWLDAATALPLRRQTFDGRGRMVSEASFAVLTLGPYVAEERPGSIPRPWDDALTPAQLARLQAQGWPLPGPLPGNLVLLGAREDTTRSGPVVDLDYSDGLSLVSIFLQRGHLRSRMTGLARLSLGGGVYADAAGGQCLIWSAQGFVYTVVAAAPPHTVAQVIAALPHGGRGLLARMRQGLHRLLAWISP